jgi:transcriptional regulator with XRE-family HTH domain
MISPTSRKALKTSTDSNPPAQVKKDRRAKTDQILEGCKRLAGSQQPGQCFSLRDIGRACGVDHGAIRLIERRASSNFARRLHRLCPDLVEEIFKDRPLREIFAGIARDPEKPVKVAERKKKKPVEKPICEVTMTEVVRELNHRNSDRRWSSEKSREKSHRLYLGRVALAEAKARNQQLTVLQDAEKSLKDMSAPPEEAA